jgi:monofunctional biosynthetic peptidoglycan transglycosylase
MITGLLMSTALMSASSLDMGIEPWRSINDGVMGGLSAGSMQQTDVGLKFTGNLSLENNGGFSSVRRLVGTDLSHATRVRLEVRGDGREYQFRIRHDKRFDGVAWRAMFSAGDEWQSVEIPLSEFVPVFRGRLVRSAGPVDASRINQVGFLLADKNPGNFELEIRNIEFLGGHNHPAP